MNMIWFGLVLWFINHCRLFIFQLLFIHIRYIYMIWFDWFLMAYQLLLGYLNSRSFLYIYILYAIS